LEPIALYHTRDLHSPGDGGWLTADNGDQAPIGRARTHGPSAAELTMITFGNGVPMSLRVAERLRGRGVSARVCDLRWLAPLPTEDVLVEATRTGRVRSSTRPGMMAAWARASSPAWSNTASPARSAGSPA
jgi:2-oxoisovalerate dehydrogenase E1 component